MLTTAEAITLAARVLEPYNAGPLEIGFAASIIAAGVEQSEMRAAFDQYQRARVGGNVVRMKR